MVEEATRQLGINKPWLYDAIQWKRCPCYRFRKTMIRVKLSEVQEWLEQRKKE
jgi:excisionase family DNA binding protein